MIVWDCSELDMRSLSMVMLRSVFVFFKQKTAYEMRISDWSSDVCSSDLVGLAGATLAQDMPKTPLKVVGAWGNLTQYKNFEQPFWTKEVNEKSGGAITAEITPFNEMGLKGAEIFRLMRLGVIDFGSTVLGYVAADDARNEEIGRAHV